MSVLTIATQRNITEDALFEKNPVPSANRNRAIQPVARGYIRHLSRNTKIICALKACEVMTAEGNP
jgi:hypothetical protein